MNLRIESAPTNEIFLSASSFFDVEKFLDFVFGVGFWFFAEFLDQLSWNFFFWFPAFWAVFVAPNYAKSNFAANSFFVDHFHDFFFFSLTETKNGLKNRKL